jgi:hypothetical protein
MKVKEAVARRKIIARDEVRELLLLPIIFLGASRMRYIFAMFVTVLLAGCTVTPPSVRIASPVPVIAVETPDHDHGHGHGRHCPPGQAKKGRC